MQDLRQWAHAGTADSDKVDPLDLRKPICGRLFGGCRTVHHRHTFPVRRRAVLLNFEKSPSYYIAKPQKNKHFFAFSKRISCADRHIVRWTGGINRQKIESCVHSSLSRSENPLHTAQMDMPHPEKRNILYFWIEKKGEIWYT